MTRDARILVVDDDPGVLRAVERVLGRRYDVQTSSAPDAAVEIAAEFDPDIAICDIRMPGKDGFAVADELRACCTNVDVILMTGSMTDTDAMLTRALQNRAFYFILKPFRRGALDALIERCLEVRRLRAAEQASLRRVKQELSEAVALQRAMLAPDHRSFEGVSIDARYRACTELGGDFYDYVRVSPNRVALIVADVCGHGVAAALLTATVKSCFRAESRTRFDPVSVLDRLVLALSDFPPNRFASAVCGVLDTDADTFTYVNAGHPAPLVFRSGGGAEPLGVGSPIASPAFPEGSWIREDAPMPPGANLLLYTDGFFEQPGPEGRFGHARVQGVLRDTPPESVVDRMFVRIDEFRAGRPLEDDLTLLLARR